MQPKIDELEAELSRRIYKLFLVKFNGNKSAFARASNCSEGAVRKVFQNKQSITFNLLLRFCKALEVSPSKLIEDISFD
ncbi:helix-turn-helix transcriptional regulator [Flavobacterium sp.]|uniref:helix-turn-helix domain-containing protein n=1 Tax=Flavobacterium sp. TaxID=239 RepID=UPI00121A55A6|nr:helix-turn-helix transcriptional regulator [Flavobacterium sp.]RZJ71543.1 MAG: XRE family transcriptional regulator [Flavobacterium sp.]